LAAAGGRLWARVVDHPVDSVAIIGAAAASLVIVVNAIYLQSDPHPAPFVANPAAVRLQAENRVAATPVVAPKPAEPAVARPAVAQAPVQSVSARRHDPIADLIATPPGTPSPRVAAVQRVLAAFGYGQIRPSGLLDEPTSAAIEKFEKERKLPVTGRLSERLISELSTMTGHPVE
jgi:hypothetical protein